MTRRIIIAACFLLGLAGPPRAGAQVLAAGASAEGFSHLWLVLAEGGRATVFHRATPDTASTPNRVFRVAQVLEAVPTAVAAHGDRLFLCFEDRFVIASEGPPPAPPGPTQVRSIRAVGAEGAWVTRPTGTLDSLPALPADRPVLAIARADAGLAAIVGPSRRTPDAGAELMLLGASSWRAVPLSPRLRSLPPFAGRSSGARASMTGVPSGLVLCLSDASGLHLFLARVEPSTKTGASRGALADATNLLWTELVPPAALMEAGEASIACAGEQVLVVRIAASGKAILDAASISRGGVGPWRRLAELDVSPGAAVAALPGAGRLVLVQQGEAPGGRPSAASTRVLEVSSATGRVLDDGDLGIRGPASGADVRMLVIVMAYAIGLVAVLLVRADEDSGVILLPSGWALAEPLRRVMAGLIDLTIALACAGQLQGRGFLELLQTSAGALIGTGWGQLVLLTTLGLLIVIGTLSESIFGRSPGKWLTGCAVLDVRPNGRPDREATPPALRNSLVRNLIKWGLPPLGLIGVFTRAGRHRGDLLAGCAVGTAAPEEPGEDEAE